MEPMNTIFTNCTSTCHVTFHLLQAYFCWFYSCDRYYASLVGSLSVTSWKIKKKHDDTKMAKYPTNFHSNLIYWYHYLTIFICVRPINLVFIFHLDLEGVSFSIQRIFQVFFISKIQDDTKMAETRKIRSTKLPHNFDRIHRCSQTPKTRFS